MSDLYPEKPNLIPLRMPKKSRMRSVIFILFQGYLPKDTQKVFQHGLFYSVRILSPECDIFMRLWICLIVLAHPNHEECVLEG
jgi:hypothetical protein